MAVELLGYTNLKEQMAIQEAASAGLKSMEHLIRAVSHQQQKQYQHLDCRDITDFTVSKFRKVISILNRTGHARFRRGPVQPQSSPSPPARTSTQPRNSVQPLSLFSLSPAPAEPQALAAAQPLTLDFTKPDAVLAKDGGDAIGKDGLSLSAAVSTSGNSSSTFVSSITGEGSVSNGKGGYPSMFLAPAGKPPLSGKRCREHDHSDNISGGKTSGSSRCHCKKRKSRVKRVMRVPAISSKLQTSHRTSTLGGSTARSQSRAHHTHGVTTNAVQ